MCLYPKFILNRKYLPNKKNKGTPPPIKDERTKYVPVGCGKCMECLKQKARNWQVRLHEEIRIDKSGKFVTLSFSEESLNELDILIPDVIKDYDRDNYIAKLALRRFLERWRKEFKTSIKHWTVTELGQRNTERIHIHGILFTNKSKETIERIWKYGNVWIGDYVNEKTVNYIIKYIHKIDKLHKYYTPTVLTSPGIGKHYLQRLDSQSNKYNSVPGLTNQLYKTRNGLKMNLPIYYRNKIYTDEQREKLWTELLDTNTRYVNKIKIDISKNEDDYYKVLKEQRKINKQFGYGNDEKDWNRIKYERDLRNLKRLQRINKYKPPYPHPLGDNDININNTD